MDDHQLVRDVRTTPSDLSPDLRISRLPFAATYRPRLIGRLGPLGFTPDGDGHADTWAPQFDVTKPLRSASLKITDWSGAKTVRTFSTDAPDGSLRGLVWDGRNRKGAVAPVGTYRWTLTGRADDGEGALIGTDGSATITGTLEIDAIDGTG